MQQYRNTLISLFLFFLSATIGKAQELSEHAAPSLQIGLNGLSFSRGELDARLIMEIIAEKQEEVKLKLVQNMLLGRLEEAGGSVYAFADDIVKNILTENDTELRTRKIIESSVNLSFSVALTKYFLEIANSNDQSYIVLLAETFGISSITASTVSQITSYVRTNTTTSTGRSTSAFFQDENSLPFLVLMLDMSSEVVRSNTKLKELGMSGFSYGSSYFNLNEYLALSPFNSTITLASINSKNITAARVASDAGNPEDLITIRYRLAQALHTSLSNKLNELVDYIGLIHYLISQRESVLDKKNISSFSYNAFLGLLQPVFGSNTADYKIGAIPTDFKQHYKETIEWLKILNLNALITANPTLKNELAKVSRYILYLERIVSLQSVTTTVPREYSDVLYHISTSIVPALTELSHLDAGLVKATITLERANILLQAALLERYSNKSFLTDTNNKMFLKLLSVMYEFDKLKTYSDYVNFLGDVADLMPDDRLRATITSIVSFVNEFALIKQNDEGQDYIDFKVESFLLKLQQIKYDKWSPFEFLLTVGTNSANFYKNPVLVDSENIYNYSFVSEKIGVKCKILDFKYVNSHGKGDTYTYLFKTYKRLVPPKEPAISNVHLLAYGSGILYNLANVGTTKDFNSPMLGAGAGITFFNNLDFNLSIGLPIIKGQHFKENYSQPFWNMGFDIQFTEYITKLKERNKQKKIQNKLDKAVEREYQMIMTR
jgi:hypothetical protein